MRKKTFLNTVYSVYTVNSESKTTLIYIYIVLEVAPVLYATKATKFEPRHDKTNKMSVRPVKTDQPGYPPSKDPRFLHADSEDSGQIGGFPG